MCTMVDIRCYIDANDRFAKDLMVRKCKCLPDCTSITYDLEISQTPMQMFDSDGEIAHWFMRNESRYLLNILPKELKSNFFSSILY